MFSNIIRNVLYFFAALGAREKFSPQTSTTFNSEYDYIVVGAGTAGSVIASRLSEDYGSTVLLLEAGTTPQPMSEIPVLAFLLQGTEMDWKYKTEPQKRCGYGIVNRQLPWPRGKAVGGTSILNFLIYTRGNKKDYDEWARNGATGWSWRDVYPYFLKSEDNKDYDFAHNGYHNEGGLLTVSSPAYRTKIMDAFAEAGRERGYEYKDINAANQTGFYRMQGTLKGGRRCSTAKAFLLPAENRANLDIIDKAFVTKILIKDKKAYGVTFDKGGSTYVVRARKEVIVSGGTINSPQLLMLSGIGPKYHLRRLGIPLVADLPVGNNLQDHVGTAGLNFVAEEASPMMPDMLMNMDNILRYSVDRKGPVTSFSGVEGIAYINTKYANKSADWPDAEIHLASGSQIADGGMIMRRTTGMNNEVFEQVYKPYMHAKTFTFFPCVLRARSKGYIRLRSTNPYVHPIIDPNLFSDPYDIRILVEVMKECVNIIENTRAFRQLKSRMFQTSFPGCEQFKLYSDEYMECVARSYTVTLYHPVGTCKMGAINDPMTVVDPELRVKGIKNLRVVDGSIMPTIVSGNTNIPIIMIAEKASDLIKARNRS